MTLKAKAALAFFAVATFVAPAATAQDKTKITIATEGAFPPYNLTRPDGTLDGYEIELGNHLCAQMKIECTFVAQSFEGIIPALQAGKFDVIMSGMSATAKRKEIIDFSIPYGGTGQTFVTLKGSDITKMPLKGEVFNLANNPDGTKKAVEAIRPILEGKTIGVQTSSIGSRFLDEYMKDVATIREYKTTEQHDLDLTSGRVDAVIASLGYMITAVKQPGNEEMEIVGPRFLGGFLGAGTSVGLRKDETALREKFDTAIEAAKADGTIKRLSEKWFGFDLTPR
ncbi:transporter substrate-binding domain-containing protein [Mangrovicella endophytica]|uniref:transporter substrate-binding domain-containing protein n=1 Tax=Mangrovicella endophytica TaxID=2066697 RepID=UPI000C9DC98F|nr:transporter substrate-binding domain-containing protein [Mangrovicella endophytica]